jgi:hypothetical protein
MNEAIEVTPFEFDGIAPGMAAMCEDGAFRFVCRVWPWAIRKGQRVRRVAVQKREGGQMRFWITPKVSA